MALIGIDFDHTLVDGDTPLEGAKDAINLLREKGHKILIYSANRKEWIEQVLNNHDIRFDRIWTDRGKPNCDIFVDDKGYRFGGDWGVAKLDILALVDGLDNRKW